MKKRSWIWVALSLHLAKWVYLFRGIDFSSQFPIVNYDYIQYYARVLRMSEFFHRSGRLWGYDPYEMAGYPAVFREMGTYFFALICIAFDKVISPKNTLLAIEIIGHVFVPLLVYPSIRNFGGSRNQALIGLVITSAMYSGTEFVVSNLMIGGLFGFIVGSFVAIWQASLFFRWTKRPQLTTGISFIIASVILPQIHPASVLIALIPNITTLLLGARRFKVRDWVLIGLTLAVVILGNWYWLHPAIAFRDWMKPLPEWLSGAPWLMEVLFPLQSTWLNSFRNLIELALLVLSLVAVRSDFNEDRDRSILFGVWISAIIAILFFGGHISFLDKLSPRRYLYAYLFLVFTMCPFAFRRYSSWPPVIKKLIVSFACLFACVAIYSQMNPGTRLAQDFTTRLPEGTEALSKYVSSRSHLNGRILLESTWHMEPAIGDYLTVLTRQPIFGGPDTGNSLLNGFTIFGMRAMRDGEAGLMMFGRPISAFRENEALLADYLARYNIALVAAYSPEAIASFERHPNLLIPKTAAGKFRVYQVVIESSWFLQGTGNLAADYDRLVLEEPSAGHLILKYHWIKTLRSDPPVDLRPVFIQDDPVPFIGLENRSNLKEITIYNAAFSRHVTN